MRSKAPYLLLALVIGLLPGVVLGGLDPKTDSIGVYFDPSGNVNGIMFQPVYAPFPVYLLLMNPASATNGFECTVTTVGAPYYALSSTLGGTGALDADASVNGFAVSAASPYPVVNGAIVLVTWSFMMQSTAPLDFFITQATVPSLPGGMPVVTGDGVLRQCTVASGYVAGSCARVNGHGPPVPGNPVPVEPGSWGKVKALFRS